MNIRKLIGWACLSSLVLSDTIAEPCEHGVGRPVQPEFYAAIGTPLNAPIPTTDPVLLSATRPYRQGEAECRDNSHDH